MLKKMRTTLPIEQHNLNFPVHGFHIPSQQIIYIINAKNIHYEIKVPGEQVSSQDNGF